MTGVIRDPIWGTRSEAAGELAGRIEVHVSCHLAGRLRDFRVLLSDDGLVLHGHVPTYYAKQLAQQVVMETTDLPIRANQIEVDSGLANCGSERWREAL
jgi:hypothetical protein